LWHIDLLLGNDSETNNATTVTARQHLRKYATVQQPLLVSRRAQQWKYCWKQCFLLIGSDATSLDTGSRFTHSFQNSVRIRKLCRQQAEIIQNHDNENIGNIGQGEALHRKYKRLKLGGGQAYDRSSD
jgi:hypothetical protein